MTSVLVVGAGSVGSHAAAQLSETPGIDRVLVTDLDADRAETVADEIGGPVRAVRWAPGDPFPSRVGLVACALPAGDDVAVVEQAVERRIPVATCGDDPAAVRRVLQLDDAAREAGVAVAVGAGLAPGLSEVLARYGAETLDEVDEVHVARRGAAGPACEARRRRALTEAGAAVEGGSLVRRRAGGGRRLVYFPPPLGPSDCRRVASPVPTLMLGTLPGLERASVCAPVGWGQFLPGRLASLVSPGRHVTRLAGLHVEVRGRRGSVQELMAFGLVDRMPPATGAVLAVAAAVAAGVEGVEVPGASPGVHSLGLLAAPVPLLAALRRRGVRLARFEGGAPDLPVAGAQVAPLHPL